MSVYHEIFEKMPIGITLHDAADGAILDANPHFCEMLGYTRDELLELDFDALHPDEPPFTCEQARDHIQQAAQEGPQTFEWRDVTKAGETLPIEVHLRLTTIEEEQRVLAVVRDITARKRSKTALQAERDRANALFENLGEAVVGVKFDDGRPIVNAINGAFEDVFGHEEDDLVGEPLDEYIVPETERDSARDLNQLVEAGQVVEEEIQRETPDGLRTFLLRTVPYEVDDKARAYAIYFDITERKRQEERFEAFIQESTDIISVLSPNGAYQYQSPSAQRILGYEADEMIGEVAFEYVHPDDREGVMEIFAEAVVDPELVATTEYRFRHRDGSWIWIESFGNNQLDNPAIEGFVVNSREITERKEKEELLERQNERLEEFAGLVSHDLRSPLDVAKGRVELAREECDSPHLEHAERAHERMNTLIEDLLSLARQGDQVSHRERVQLDELSRLAWKQVETADAEIVHETDRVIRADPNRLQQLFENLYRNAIEHGGEDVSVTVGDLESGFYVADDGAGIHEDDHEDVFSVDYSTGEHGTGFGLSIVKQVVEAHGWEIEAMQSAAGGARFEVTGINVDE